MTANKSIDGLSTRAAKTSALSPTEVKTIKATKRAQTIDPLEDSLEEPIKIKTTKTDKSTVIPKKSATKPPHSSKTTKSAKAIKSRTQKIDLVEEFASAPTTSIWDTLEPVTEEDNSTADFLKPVQAFDFDEDEGLKKSDQTVKNLKKSHNQTEDDEEESEEDEDMTKKSRREEKRDKKREAKLAKKANKKPSKKRKVISIIALVIVLVLIGIAVWMILWGNDLIAKLTGGRGNLMDLLALNSETYDPLKTDSNGRTNILAFGTGGYDMSGEEGGGVHDGAQLTDSIMLISLDQKTGDTAMISLPRDLKGPATCTSTGKINEVYWCNGGGGDISTAEEEKAATALMEAIGTVLGVDIQYYAHLNWGSIVNIVDTLGGITVTLDEDILDYNYTGAVYYANTPYTLNGAEAVGLARARHGTTGGDFSRGASQQKIIVGIKNRIFEKDLSIPDMLGLVTTLGDNLRTNFSLSEMKTLAHDAQILDFDVMRHISLYPDYFTTGEIGGISYVLPRAGVGNYTTIQRYVALQLSSDPRDYEEPTIAIYNASDTDGLASAEKLKLEGKGFAVTLIDNAPAGEYKSGTNLYATTNQKPGTYRLLEDYYNYTPLTAEELPTTIAPNYDFIIILNN